MADLISVVVALVIIAVTLWKWKIQPYLKERPKKLYYNMYPSRGVRYWPKRSIMKWVVKLRRRKEKSNQTLLYNSARNKEYRESERVHSVEQNKLSIDSVYFFGTEECHGDALKETTQTERYSFIVRLARRRNGLAEFWFLLRQPDGTLLTHPSAPLTMHRDYSPNSNDGLECWSVDAGCSIVCLAPMQRWKLKFTGFLKKDGSKGDKDDLVHVDLNVTFRAFSNPVDVDKDLSPSLIADAMAREDWSREFFEKLEKQKESENQKHIEQWGAYDGTLTLDYGETRSLQMRGYRDHSYGIRNWHNYHRYVAHFGYLEDGSCFSVGSVSMPASLRHLRYGYLFTPCGKLCPITWHNIDLWNVGEFYPPVRQYTFSFRADGRRFDVRVEAEQYTEFRVGSHNGTLIAERFAKYRVNNRLAFGVNEFCYAICDEKLPAQIMDKYNSQMPLTPAALDGLALNKSIVTFQQAECDCQELVGGKACQLAALSNSRTGVMVPNGFVLTTVAYQMFLQANPDLSHFLNRSNKSADDEAISQLWQTSKIPSDLEASILSTVKTSFGSNWETVPLAVRSSATGEDGGMASGAGQMETFLNVLGKQQLFHSIIQCWASQFSEHSVAYRCQNGLPANPLMAAIVQRLVKAAKSGVIFTQDPRNGDSAKLIINANYGLGESIVSGEAEPDTYIVKRLPNAKFELDNVKVGTKSIQTKPKDNGGVETVSQTYEAHIELTHCLSNEEIHELVETAIMIEVAYRSARDIEWALGDDGRLYILQARPITTLHQETEHDLVHEFDSALAFGKEFLTTANIGEMMPSAVTPLTLSVFADAIDKVLQNDAIAFGLLHDFHCARRGLPSYCNHLFINIHMLGLVSQLHMMSGRLEMVYLALLGRVIDRPNLNDIEYFSGRSRLFFRIRNFIRSTHKRMSSTKKTKVWEDKFRAGYVVPPQDNAKDQLQAIDNQLDDYYKCWYETVPNSANSAMWSLVILKILDQNETWSNEVFAKVAHLLSSCENVYSADVPTALQELARSIAKSSNSQKFLELDVEAATNWLLSEQSEHAGVSFRSFLNRHGHRCVRESEFRETSWNTEPSKVVSVLKVMVSNEVQFPTENEKKILSVEDAIASLDIPLSSFKKQILKYLLPKARLGVAQREWGKSLSIEMVNHFKNAYSRLAGLAATEGLLPDADLLYFFTHDELLILLLEDTKLGIKQHLISKAQKRRRTLEKQMSQVFPETVEGIPTIQTEEESLPENGASSIKLTGLTVSHGAKRGTARVICSLQEAKKIQKGDILIVPYTDIGWTPYFPLISGLVTEKGGLLSHGAVVAREFGLPCLVGVKGATAVFNTGDSVYLNSSKGYIEKCEETVEENI